MTVSARQENLFSEAHALLRIYRKHIDNGLVGGLANLIVTAGKQSTIRVGEGLPVYPA